MQKITYVRILLSFAVVCLLAPLCTFGEFIDKTETVLVGAVLPLSGDYAQYGRELERGILLAETELNRAHTKVKVFIEDGGTMVARSGLTAATKLIHINGAKAIMVLGADDVGPLLGLAKSSHVPILSLWDSSRTLHDMGEYVFSNGFSVEATGPKFARLFYSKLDLTRIAIIGNSTSWSTSISDAFRNEITKLGGSVVFNEAVTDDWVDFRTIILRLKRTNAQALFLPLSLPSGVIACIRQLRELGVSIPIATGEALVGDAMKQLGPAAEGVYVGWPPSATDTALSQAYKARFSEEPWNASIYKVGYDGLYSVVNAANRSPGKGLTTALSEFYGSSRSANREYSLFKVKGRQLMAME